MVRERVARLLTKAAQALVPVSSSRARGGGWFPLVREPYTGAWQQDAEAWGADVLSYGPVFTCVSMIAQDIAKLNLRLVTQDPVAGIWTDTTNPAYSPVLRKPNRYQTRIKFVESWISSKLIWGNTYVLKERDARGVVVALYVLNPYRVRPLIAPDGSVYYELPADQTALLAEITIAQTVPASEIIHDTMVCLYHPLCGVTPIYACGTAALQGLAMQANSSKFFANGSNPGGVLTSPGSIDEDTAKRIKDYWDANFTGQNAGKVAVLSDGLEFKPAAINAVDADLIKQLDWTGVDVCACYHVPPQLAFVMTPSSHATSYTPLQQVYYSECLQSLIANFELALDEGLGLLTPINGTQYGVEFDLADLIWMDAEMRAKVAGDCVSRGILSPNEARATYVGRPPVPGGETPYLQEQNWPLQLLADRELPTRTPTTPAPLPPTETPPPPAEKEYRDDDLAALVGDLFADAWAA